MLFYVICATGMTAFVYIALITAASDNNTVKEKYGTINIIGIIIFTITLIYILGRRDINRLTNVSIRNNSQNTITNNNQNTTNNTIVELNQINKENNKAQTKIRLQDTLIPDKLSMYFNETTKPPEITTTTYDDKTIKTTKIESTKGILLYERTETIENNGNWSDIQIKYIGNKKIELETYSDDRKYYKVYIDGNIVDNRIDYSNNQGERYKYKYNDQNKRISEEKYTRDGEMIYSKNFE